MDSWRGVESGTTGAVGSRYVVGRTTYGRNHGSRPAGALGSGIAVGLWTIEFGIAGAADVEYHSGRNYRYGYRPARAERTWMMDL